MAARTNVDVALDSVAQAVANRKAGSLEKSLEYYKLALEAFIREMKSRPEGTNEYLRFKGMAQQIFNDAEATQAELRAVQSKQPQRSTEPSGSNSSSGSGAGKSTLTGFWSTLFGSSSAKPQPARNASDSVPDNYNYYKPPEVKVNPNSNFASPVGQYVPPVNKNMGVSGSAGGGGIKQPNTTNINSNSSSPRTNLSNSSSSGGINKAQPGGMVVKAGEEKVDEYETRILSELLDTNPNVKFSDIAGLQFPIQILKEAVVLPNLRPDLFTGLRAPPRGVLLYGPPGTGKTLLAKAVATESRFSFFSITSSSISSKYHGEGEKLVKALFSVATKRQPAVIFMDEIDSILSARSESEHEASRRVKTEFMTQVDGATTNSETRLLVMGATNLPWGLDEAVLRRFVKRICIPLPDKVARLSLITKLLQKQSGVDGSGSSSGGILGILGGGRQTSDTITADQLDRLAVGTEGYSASDITALVKEAAMGPIRSLSPEALLSVNKADIRPINFNDVNDALKVIRPSVSADSLQDYHDWTLKYGSER